MTEPVKVGRADEIEEGEAKAFPVNGAEIAVSRVSDTNLSLGGEIDGTSITCECHGSSFDMTTGAVLEGPATEPIATFPVREENGDLLIEA